MAAKSKRGRGQTTLSLGPDDSSATLSTLPGVSVRAREGRTERAVAASIRAGRDGAAADPRYAGAESLARSLARGIDVARGEGDPYALAQLGPKLLDVLRELQLTPPPRAVGADDLAELLGGLSAAE